MNKKLHVIYLPGVGDSNPVFQRRAVRTWRWWGVEAELFHINWASDEPWATKFVRITDRIDELNALGKNVALVGASAGGSAALNSFSARKSNVVGAVFISAKLKNPEDIGQNYRSANPALLDSVTESDSVLEELTSRDVQKFLTRRAVFDEVVSKTGDSQIQGARNQVSPTVGHAITIAFQLVFGAPGFLRFLKSQNVQFAL